VIFLIFVDYFIFDVFRYRFFTGFDIIFLGSSMKK